MSFQRSLKTLTETSLKFPNIVRATFAARQQSTSATTDLKSRLEELIPVKRQEVAEFRKEHGNTKIGEVTVNMAYGGNFDFIKII